MISSMGKYFLQPGYIFVSEQPYLIHTVLGSCVSVCIWDSMRKFGGMNHYIYSKAHSNERNGKYGDVSIPYLLRLIMNMGSHKHDLKAHVVGGGRNPHLSPGIGEENSQIALDILKSSGIEIITADFGGQTGRKVVFNNESGEILVHKGINIRKSDWYEDYGK